MARTAPKLPDYNVLTWVDPNDHDKGLMPIGGAWKSTSRDTGNEYISVRLNAKPWNGWDGTLQLHERTNNDDPPM
jgi:uncharacterized protein (DUF736 family)